MNWTMLYGYFANASALLWMLWGRVQSYYLAASIPWRCSVETEKERDYRKILVGKAMPSSESRRYSFWRELAFTGFHFIFTIAAVLSLATTGTSRFLHLTINAFFHLLSNANLVLGCFNAYHWFANKANRKRYLLSTAQAAYLIWLFLHRANLQVMVGPRMLMTAAASGCLQMLFTWPVASKNIIKLLLCAPVVMAYLYITAKLCWLFPSIMALSMSTAVVAALYLRWDAQQQALTQYLCTRWQSPWQEKAAVAGITALVLPFCGLCCMLLTYLSRQNHLWGVLIARAVVFPVLCWSFTAAVFHVLQPLCALLRLACDHYLTPIWRNSPTRLRDFFAARVTMTADQFWQKVAVCCTWLSVIPAFIWSPLLLLRYAWPVRWLNLGHSVVVGGLLSLQMQKFMARYSWRYPGPDGVNTRRSAWPITAQDQQILSGFEAWMILFLSNISAVYVLSTVAFPRPANNFLHAVEAIANTVFSNRWLCLVPPLAFVANEMVFAILPARVQSSLDYFFSGSKFGLSSQFTRAIMKSSSMMAPLLFAQTWLHYPHYHHRGLGFWLAGWSALHAGMGTSSVLLCGIVMNVLRLIYPNQGSKHNHNEKQVYANYTRVFWVMVLLARSSTLLLRYVSPRLLLGWSALLLVSPVLVRIITFSATDDKKTARRKRFSRDRQGQGAASSSTLNPAASRFAIANATSRSSSTFPAPSAPPADPIPSAPPLPRGGDAIA